MVTERAKALYEYLLMQREFNKGVYIPKEKIQEELMYYYKYKAHVEEHNQACFGQIRADIRELRNASVNEIKYVIISSPKGYKLATQEEYEEYSKRNWIKIKRMIITQANQDKKAGLNHQVNLFTKEEITPFVK